MPISKFNCDIIDSCLDLLLTELYTLPKDAAIAALKTLIDLPMISNDAKTYPPLPALFQTNPIYKTTVIQDVLQKLSEIMYNRQPQNQVSASQDAGPDVYYGKFGLRSSQGEHICTEDVHNYLKYKFAITALSIWALPSATKIINGWQANSAFKSIYYQNLAEWIKASSGEGMPQSMQNLIASNGVLRLAIKKALATALSQDGALLFTLSYLLQTLTDLEEKTTSITNELSSRQVSIITEQVINILFSLEPTAYDPRMEACFNALFCSTMIGTSKEAFFTVFKQDPYKAVRAKLQQQIETGDKTFQHVAEVSLAFIKVAQAQEYLNLYGNLIKVDAGRVTEEVTGICTRFVQHLDEASASEQKPLAANENAQLDAFLDLANQCKNQYFKEKEFADWISNFFALYFNSPEDQTSLLRKMYHFAFTQKTLAADDNWLTACLQKNFDSSDNVVNVSPYEINRIILHALITPVEDWSDIYYTAFHAVLTQVFPLFANGDSNNRLIQRLGEDSYSPAFIAQLNWLRERYVNKHLDLNLYLENQPPSAFPMLYYPTNSCELVDILSTLLADQISLVFAKLLHCIEDALTFFAILKRLEPTQRTAIYEVCKAKIPQLICNGYDLATVLYYLTPAQSTAVYESVKVSLPALIQQSNDFAAALACLAPEQITALCGALKDRLPDIIKTSASLCNVLEKLSPEQKTAFCASVQDRLPMLIKSLHNFSAVLPYLNSMERTALYEQCKDRLPHYLKDKDYLDLAAMLKYLQPSQITAVCACVKNRLSIFFNNVSNFSHVLGVLDHGQITAVCESLKEHWPTFSNDIIGDIDNFAYMLRCLNKPVQITSLCINLKDYLLNLITDGDDFDELLRDLNTESRTAVYESIKAHLPAMINNAENFGLICYWLEPLQRTAIYESVAASLPTMIKNVRDFAAVVYSLNPEQITAVCTGLEISLSAIITEKKDFAIRQLTTLSADQQQAVRGACLHIILEDYIDEIKDEQATDSSNAAFYKPAYSITARISAAAALKFAISRDLNNLDRQHLGALLDGKLRQIIQNYLTIHRPNISIEEFLESKTSPLLDLTPG